MRRSQLRILWIVTGPILLIVPGCIGTRSILIQLATTDVPVEAIGDCGFRRTAYAWIDQNGNGQRDDDETSLAGVTLIVEDTVSGYATRSQPSDPQGNLSLSIFLGGCPEVAFQLSADPPTGYVATTRQPIRSSYPAEDEPFLFGFRRAD